jgi:hypothetical protein
MSISTRAWLQRLAALPFVALFPFVAVILFCELAAWLTGDPQPIMATLPAAILIIWLTWSFSADLLFARREWLLSHGGRLLCWLVAGEMASVAIILIMIAPTLSHDPEKLRLTEVSPASVNLRGRWEGTWTDSRRGSPKNIRLFLDQEGNRLWGRILDERDREWKIVEGTVSGDRIHARYELLRFGSGYDGGATLLGSCADMELKGEYFEHVRSRPGFSSKGSWSARRVTPP